MSRKKNLAQNKTPKLYKFVFSSVAKESLQRQSLFL